MDLIRTFTGPLGPITTLVTMAFQVSFPINYGQSLDMTIAHLFTQRPIRNDDFKEIYQTTITTRIKQASRQILQKKAKQVGCHTKELGTKLLGYTAEGRCLSHHQKNTRLHILQDTSNSV